MTLMVSRPAALRSSSPMAPSLSKCQAGGVAELRMTGSYRQSTRSFPRRAASSSSGGFQWYCGQQQPSKGRVLSIDRVRDELARDVAHRSPPSSPHSAGPQHRPLSERCKTQLSGPFGVFLGPWWRKRRQVSFRHGVRCEFVLEECKVSGLKVGFPDARVRRTVRKLGCFSSRGGQDKPSSDAADYITALFIRVSGWLLSGKCPLFRPFMF